MDAGNMLSSLSMRRTKATMASSIHSGIHLGLHIYSKMSEEESKVTDTHSDLDPTLTTYSITYQLTYGGHDTVWTENNVTRLHKSQQVGLEYVLGSPD